MDHSSSHSSSSLFSAPVIIALFLFAIGLIVGAVIGVVARGGVDEVKNSMVSMRGEVSRMRWETDELVQKINGVQGAVDAGQAEVAEKIKSIGAGQAEFSKKLETVGAGQAELSKKLASESQRIGGLDAKVQGLAKGQEELKAAGNKFASQLASEIKRINDVGAKVQAIEKAVAAGTAETRKLAADRDAIRADLSRLRAEFGSTDSSFDELIAALAGIGVEGAE